MARTPPGAGGGGGRAGVNGYDTRAAAEKRGASWLPGRPASRLASALTAAAALAAGCATSRPVPAPAPPPAVAVGWREEGLASWYGEPYHGRPTASGARYDMHEMTAAHRFLPFGTEVEVQHRQTGATVRVVINDRGPFVAGRILDLSRAAAQRLGALAHGVVPVRLSVLRLGDGMPTAPCWEVQVGAFAQEANVLRATERLEAAGYRVRLSPAGGGLTRVRATEIGDLAAAQRAVAHLAASFPGAVAVPCPSLAGGGS